MTKPVLAIALCSLLGACSLVEPIPGSNRVIMSNDLNSCTVIGETSVKVLETVLGLNIRKEVAIQDELQTLARNEAIAINANAIWPTSEVSEGSQTYNLLRCQPNPGR